MQCMVGMHPYKGLAGIAGNGSGAVEVFMCTSPRDNFPKEAKIFEPSESETLEVHGQLEYVLDAFRQVVRMLEDNRSTCADAGPKRALGCPDCAEPKASDPHWHDSHTWECQAKWSEVARGVLRETPTMSQTQREMVIAGLEKAKGEHLDCGGAGCSECQFTGLVVFVEVVPDPKVASVDELSELRKMVGLS
jgi:hypothetical protein